LPIYINPPAKVKRQTLIHTILTDIKRLKDGANLDWNPDNPTPNQEWVIVTFEDLKLQVRIEGDQALLLNKTGGITDDNGDPLSWVNVLKPFGELRLGISNLRLRRGSDPGDPSQDIVAVIDAIDEQQSNLIYITVDSDTLPTTTINAVNAIIDPTRSMPGKALLAASLGQRYLIVEDCPENIQWGITNAKANDIIEYNGSSWIVSFNSEVNSSATVLNIATNLIYEWRSNQWISASEGTYRNGWWRLYL
jgi:hypothetical protein